MPLGGGGNNKGEAPMRWLHCSDFHMGKDRTAQERLWERILEHVKQRFDAGFVPDVVFLTGDLANQGLPKEYEAVRGGFLGPLRERLGGNAWKGRILAVPGNHDVDRTKNDDFTRDDPLQAAAKFFDPDKTGQGKREILSPRFKAYRQKATVDVNGNWVSTQDGAFAEVIEFPGLKVGVVGINTAWLSKDDKDQGRLTPGFPLVEAALKKVQGCQVRFVLGHHPLYWLEEGQERRLRALFGHHRVIYLHGHLHRAEARQEDGAGQGFLVLQAGAAFQARDGEPWRNGILWGEIGPAAKELRVSPRFWNPDNYDWPVETARFPERLRDGDWWVYPPCPPPSPRRPSSRPGSPPPAGRY